MIKTFYFEELTKTDRELYKASREAKLWSQSAVEGIPGGRGGHLLSGRKMNQTQMNIADENLKISTMAFSMGIWMEAKQNIKWNSFSKKIIIENDDLSIIRFYILDF